MNLGDISSLARIPGTEFSVTSTGAVVRRVKCEKCNQEYLYLLERTITASERSILNLDSAGAEQRASEQARELLHSLLAEDIDPVPCPGCGHYQPEMLVASRAQYGFWMNVVSLLAAFGLAYSLIALSSAFAGDFGRTSSPTWKVVSVTIFVACLVLGPGLYVLRRFLAARFDPNQIDLQKRLALGRSKAVLADADGEQEMRQRQQAFEVEAAERAVAAERSGIHWHYFQRLGLPLVVGGLCVFLLIRNWPDVRRGAASTTWPTTVGRLRPVRLDTRSERKGGLDVYYYTPVASYSYTVAGREYLGDRLTFVAAKFRDQHVAQAILTDLQEQADLQVSYDPSDPSVSVLLPGGRENGPTLMMVLAGISTLCATAFAYYLWKYRLALRRK